MPEKNPSSWIAVWDALPEPVRAAIIGAIVSFFRVMYDDKEPRWLRRAFEVALCAALGFTVSYAVTAMGFSSGWGGAAAGVIGVYGVEQVRSWGRALAQKRIDQGAP